MTAEVINLPVFVDVHDVRKTMKCSRSVAYEHMRRAVGRQTGQRGQLRVPLYVWREYVDLHFNPKSVTVEVVELRPPRDRKSFATNRIRITRPRTKPRALATTPDKH